MNETAVNTTDRPSSVGRSIVAVLAGIIVTVVLSIGTDKVMHAAGIFPQLGQSMSDSLFLLATAYRTIYSVAGAYLTARLAPNRPMAHALWLGALGLVLGTVGAVVTWNKVPSLGPHWYPVALVVLSLPQCWLGGFLYRGKQAGQ
ncbi:MAG: hypothetical protein LAO20_01915 [Acidobacteriia bacterium]|nr:hypothetical protein [Terriglobia bacterium]